MSFEIVIDPFGRSVACESGKTIMDALRGADITLTATCGGNGTCGCCIVRVTGGHVSSPPHMTEEAALGSERINDGWRLACQTKILDDARIYIPPESLATGLRTQTEGRHPDIEPNNSTIIGIRSADSSALGLAVDLGTTKLAAYLIDLTDGKTLAAAGAINPQIVFGEDVMTRIHYTFKKPDGAGQLRKTIVEAVNKLAKELCSRAGRRTGDIADSVIVGNTAMHHLFLGLPVRQLGSAPYVPAEKAALDVTAQEAGLEFAPCTNVHLLPNIAGFIGADHVAMLIGSKMREQGEVVLGIDIGTNTEISLVAHGKHFACSAASGPAFEGAHIRHGMRAMPGAIEKVLIHDGQVQFQTIDNQPPAGLCGSGILDLVAQMRKAGIIDRRGALAVSGHHPRIRIGSDRGLEFIVVSADENHGTEITFDRCDVNEIQLAKGAIRAGINILFKRAKINENDIRHVIIAGAFGTYLDIQSGIDIGMFPRLEKDRFVQVGNAAGTGARMALLSIARRKQAVEIARQVNYVELTAEKDFSSVFAEALMLDC